MSRNCILVTAIICIFGLGSVIVAQNKLVGLTEQQVQLTAPSSEAMAAISASGQAVATVEVDN